MSRKKRLDDLMEAITFAEVGEIDTARGIASRIFPDEQALQGERILAVSSAPGFSGKMVEHAIGMAERLDYGLVALTVPPALARLVARLRRRSPGSASAKGGWLPPDVFRARAIERGIPFVHAVGSGDPEKAVAAARKRFRRIAFLLLEPELKSTAGFYAVNLPIFTLDDA